MVRLFSATFSENKILPPYFMKIAITSARIKGLKTYWGEYIYWAAFLPGLV
jgi:hypothetical protein